MNTCSFFSFFFLSVGGTSEREREKSCIFKLKWSRAAKKKTFFQWSKATTTTAKILRKNAHMVKKKPPTQKNPSKSFFFLPSCGIIRFPPNSYAVSEGGRGRGGRQQSCQIFWVRVKKTSIASSKEKPTQQINIAPQKGFTCIKEFLGLKKGPTWFFMKPSGSTGRHLLPGREKLLSL